MININHPTDFEHGFDIRYLEKIPIHLYQEMRVNPMNGTPIEYVAREMSKSFEKMLRVEAITEVWCEKARVVEVTATATATASVRYPANIWQHFKRDYMPKWFVRRWPVVTQTIKDRKQSSKTQKETIYAVFGDYSPPNDMDRNAMSYTLAFRKR